jgi:hypothetical protein
MLEIRIGLSLNMQKKWFSEKKPSGTLVVDAQSGAMRSYTIAKTPNGSIEFSPWNLSKTN